MRRYDEHTPAPTTRSGRILCLLLSLCLFFTVLSFCLWEEGDGSGALSASAAWIRETLEENEAIAVFLGWEEGLPS